MTVCRKETTKWLCRWQQLEIINCRLVNFRLRDFVYIEMKSKEEKKIELACPIKS